MTGLKIHFACMFVRLGFAEGKAGKPSICITSSFQVWLGNLTDADANFDPQELFGFGLGQYEERPVSTLVL